MKTTSFPYFIRGLLNWSSTQSAERKKKGGVLEKEILELWWPWLFKSLHILDSLLPEACLTEQNQQHILNTAKNVNSGLPNLAAFQLVF